MALAVVLAVGTVLVVRASSGTAGPSEPDFTHFPSAGCALITKATADTYAPGITCQVAQDHRSSDSTLIGVNWLPPRVGDGPTSAVLSVNLVIFTGTPADSDAAKWVGNTARMGWLAGFALDPGSATERVWSTPRSTAPPRTWMSGPAMW